MDIDEVTSADELYDFVVARFGVRVPRQAVCPGHVSPWEYVSGSFLEDRDLAVWACRGGGKSYAAALATLLKAMAHPGSQQIVLGGSQAQSERVAEHIQTLLERVPRLRHRRSRQGRIRLSNDSAIHVLAQSETSVRGLHVQGVRCDELDLFDPQVWRAIWFCTAGREDRRGSLDVLSTAHVPGGLMEDLIERCRAGTYPARLLSWCLWEVIERCDSSTGAGIASCGSTGVGPVCSGGVPPAKEHPLHASPAARRCQDCLLADDCQGKARQADGFFRIDDAIAMKARASRSAWECEMLCRGARREHLVFAEFDVNLHVAPLDLTSEFMTYRGVDFGYASPLVCLWVQVTPGGGVHVVDEYVQVRRSIPANAEAIKARHAVDVKATYVDPAGKGKEASSGQSCIDLFEKHGIPCTWRTSTIAEGLELIRAHLAPAVGEPTLKLAPRCRKLIRAFQTYHYPSPGQGGAGEWSDPGSVDSAALSAGLGRPVKDGPDHLLDALRYFFVNRMRPNAEVRRKRY